MYVTINHGRGRRTVLEDSVLERLNLPLCSEQYNALLLMGVVHKKI